MPQVNSNLPEIQLLSSYFIHFIISVTSVVDQKQAFRN